ncbi:MAG: peptide deformylase [Patescibacteria group bacterium]|nr:peptide deformylase [Patescibacteria group bacterium]
MALLTLKIYPEPILRSQAKTLTTEELRSQEIQQLILDMGQTMQQADGVGLAAPQVGKSISLAVINTEDGNLVLINPKISYKSWRQELGEEGCLSIPKVFGLVKRSIKIKITALDQTGKKIKFTATGMFARVIQHEIDHLNGVLFIDKAKEISSGQEILKTMQKQK